MKRPTPRRFPTFLQLGALVAALALGPACAPRPRPAKIALLLSTLQEERYQKDRAYFEARAKALGLEPMVLAADNDNARQLAQVEDALTQGAKVLVIQPTDSQAAAAYVRLAHEAGAKVVAYDRQIADSGLDASVAHDSYRVGVLQAEAALAATGGRGKFVILAGQAGHSVAAEITRGVKDTLAPALARGAVTIVTEQSHSAWSPEQALRTVEDTLVRVGRVDAILANNSGLARGAVQAVSRAGLAPVFIAGADADAANVNFVCEGKQAVEVLKDIRPLAEAAADLAATLVRGEAVTTPAKVTLGGRAVPLVAVRVVLVTADTVKPLIVDSGFLPASSLPGCAARLARRERDGDRNHGGAP
jgi:D-xylose transport system substrate-binding protein